jgi:hypothetical protein
VLDSRASTYYPVDGSFLPVERVPVVLGERGTLRPVVARRGDETRHQVGRATSEPRYRLVVRTGRGSRAADGSGWGFSIVSHAVSHTQRRALAGVEADQGEGFLPKRPLTKPQVLLAIESEPSLRPKPSNSSSRGSFANSVGLGLRAARSRTATCVSRAGIHRRSSPSEFHFSTLAPAPATV